MLSIKKGGAYTLSPKSTLPYEEMYNITRLPRLAPNRCVMGFDAWSSLYSKEIETIIGKFEEYLYHMDTKEYVMSVNMTKLHDMMKKKIYETSSNKYTKSV